MNISKDPNSEKPLVSFILTCYNLPTSLVKECLESITELSLRVSEREIILVDDGSDKCILNELEDFADDIIYIRQKNRGLSVARNVGINMATGTYIQFVDADDKLITEAYEHCLDIVRYDNPDMVLFKFTDKEKKQAVFNKPEPIDGTAYMKNNNLRAPAWGYIFNRKILMGLRFTPGILHEDEEFTPMLILRAEKLYDTDITAYMYRKRETSITHNVKKRSVIKRLNDVEQTIFYLNEKVANMPVREQQALQRRIAQLTMDYIFNIMKLSKSEHQLELRLKRLEERGLFPLPDRGYTKKYTLFRHLTKNSVTRKFLLNVIK